MRASCGPRRRRHRNHEFVRAAANLDRVTLRAPATRVFIVRNPPEQLNAQNGSNLGVGHRFAAVGLQDDGQLGR